MDKNMLDARYDAARVDILAGGMSLNAIAKKHGIPEPSLRREAKRKGWVMGAADIKRQLVNDAMAGDLLPNDERLTNSSESDEDDEAVRQRRLDAATEDVRDMQKGLELARKAMDRLLLMVPAATSPKDIKLIVEAGATAVTTIRKIRHLDAEPAPAGDTNLNVTVQDESLTKLKQAFADRLGLTVEAIEGMGGAGPA